MWSLPGRFEVWDGGDMDLSEFQHWFGQAEQFENQERIEAVKWWMQMLKIRVVMPWSRTLE
jgi:hypothetical protein